MEPIGTHMVSYSLLSQEQSVLYMKPDEIESILSKKTYVKQSISDTEPEVTLICVDNSFLMDESWAGNYYKPQAEAILSYSQEKIDAHPLNNVGLLAMGTIKHYGYVKPTRDLHQISFALKRLTYFGQSCMPIGRAVTFFLESNLPKRRLLVFYGGRLTMESAELKFYATRLKRFKVAVDVVNFGLQFVPPTKYKLLQEFVEAADNDGNSHYLYAPSESETSLAQQILCSPLAPVRLPMQEEEKKEKDVKKIEEEEEKKIVEEEVMNKKKMYNKLKNYRKKLAARAEEAKKKEEEEEFKKNEEEVKKKEKMEQLQIQEEKKKEEEVKKKAGEEVKNKKKMYNKLKNYRKKLAVRAEEEKKKEEEDVKKKEEEEVKKKEEEEVKKKEKMEQLRIREEKKKEEEVKEKEKMEPHMLPVEQLERWILGLPVQEEKIKEEEQVKKKEKMQQKLNKKGKR